MGRYLADGTWEPSYEESRDKNTLSSGRARVVDHSKPGTWVANTENSSEGYNPEWADVQVDKDGFYTLTPELAKGWGGIPAGTKISAIGDQDTYILPGETTVRQFAKKESNYGTLGNLVAKVTKETGRAIDQAVPIVIPSVTMAGLSMAGGAVAGGLFGGAGAGGAVAGGTTAAGAAAGGAAAASSTAWGALFSEAIAAGATLSEAATYAGYYATLGSTAAAAAPGMLINTGSQLATTGKIDPTQLALSGVGSVAAPVVGGVYSDFGVTNPVLNAGLTGATMNAGGQLATTGNVNWQQAGVSGLLSGVTAAGKNAVGDFTKGSYESRQSTPVYDASGQYIGENTAHGFEPGFNAPGAAQSNQDLFDLNHLNNPGVDWNPDAKIDPYADPYSYDSQADAGYKYDPYGDIPGSGTGMPNGNKVGYGSGNVNYGNIAKSILGIFGGGSTGRQGGMMGGGGGDTGSLATASPSRGLNYHNPNVRQQPQVDPYAQYLSSRLGQSRDFGLLGYGNLA